MEDERWSTRDGGREMEDDERWRTTTDGGRRRIEDDRWRTTDGGREREGDSSLQPQKMFADV